MADSGCLRVSQILVNKASGDSVLQVLGNRARKNCQILPVLPMCRGGLLRRDGGFIRRGGGVLKKVCLVRGTGRRPFLQKGGCGFLRRGVVLKNPVEVLKEFDPLPPTLSVSP